MSYSITALTNDYYEGTNCLINKFNIQNEEQLAKIEAGITLAKTAELERNPISTSFDFEHYKQIHRYLFEDLYEWAGSVRTVDISKKGTNFTSKTLKITLRFFVELFFAFVSNTAILTGNCFLLKKCIKELFLKHKRLDSFIQQRSRKHSRGT